MRKFLIRKDEVELPIHLHWWRSVAVTHCVESMKLLCARPG